MAEAIEILKSLGWPHFAFAFGVVFVLIFRRHLGALLDRITSIDRGGIKTQPVPEAQREEKKSEAAQELLDAIQHSIVLKDIETRIGAELQARELDTQSDTARVLIRHLAATRILLEFEQVQYFIFGSQIFLLKKLNEVAGQGQPKSFVTAHFKRLREDVFPDTFQDWTLEQYLAFLLGRQLILLSGDTYHITNLGVEYLTWMARNGRSVVFPRIYGHI